MTPMSTKNDMVIDSSSIKATLLTDEGIKNVTCVGDITTKKQYDNIQNPKHYTSSKIEVIEYIEDKQLGFCLGNVIRYVSRAGKKDKDKEVEDLKKAKWYLERRILELEDGL